MCCERLPPTVAHVHTAETTEMILGVCGVGATASLVGSRGMVRVDQTALDVWVFGFHTEYLLLMLLQFVGY